MNETFPVERQEIIYHNETVNYINGIYGLESFLSCSLHFPAPMFFGQAVFLCFFYSLS